LRKGYPQLKELLGGDSFWSESYFIASAGWWALVFWRGMWGSGLQLMRKIRVYPSPGQEKVLWALSDQCRRLYNLALAERKDAYLRGEGIGYGVEQNGLVLLTKQFPGFCVVE
jgi:hypothetical protein